MYEYYFIFLGLLLVCAIFAGSASAKVHSTYRAQSEIGTRSHMTGYDTATRLLHAGGVRDISVGRVKGELTDPHSA